MLELHYDKHILEAGIDEAGRGCLAGPVFAAAVILHPDKIYDWYEVLNDSKQLPETMRENLKSLIEEHALAWGVAMVSPQVIDEINILNATYMAMHQAIGKLSPSQKLY
jgi:ribonuclease HII